MATICPICRRDWNASNSWWFSIALKWLSWRSHKLIPCCLSLSCWEPASSAADQFSLHPQRHDVRFRNLFRLQLDLQSYATFWSSLKCFASHSSSPLNCDHLLIDCSIVDTMNKVMIWTGPRQHCYPVQRQWTFEEIFSPLDVKTRYMANCEIAKFC